MTSKERILRLALLLRLAPVRDMYIQRWANEWWLCGCPEGDRALPNTRGVHTHAQALDDAEAWYAADIDAMPTSRDLSEQARE